MWLKCDQERLYAWTSYPLGCVFRMANPGSANVVSGGAGGAAADAVSGSAGGAASGGGAGYASEKSWTYTGPARAHFSDKLDYQSCAFIDAFVGQRCALCEEGLGVPVWTADNIFERWCLTCVLPMLGDDTQTNIHRKKGSLTPLPSLPIM